MKQPRGLARLWEVAVSAPLGGRADHPAKWVLLKDDERAMRFIVRHGPLFQDNKGASLRNIPSRSLADSLARRRRCLAVRASSLCLNTFSEADTSLFDQPEFCTCLVVPSAELMRLSKGPR